MMRTITTREINRRIRRANLIVGIATAVISGAIGFAIGIGCSDAYGRESVPVMVERPTPIHMATTADAPEIEWDYLGKFKLTAYCGCRKCNGRWYGYPTASGTDCVEGRTIAVDPGVIPLGSQIKINGHTYTAEDTGSVIRGDRIDVYMDSHADALQFGVRYADVFIISDSPAVAAAEESGK